MMGRCLRRANQFDNCESGLLKGIEVGEVGI
jgi:hypothetical protein